jgi:hypothetical protein
MRARIPKIWAAGAAAAALLVLSAGAEIRVRLVEVLTIGGPDEETLFQWTGVAVDAEGSIYVLDALDFSLKKFDAGGRLVKKTGQKGQGPGEFSQPRWLAVDGDLVYAVDQSILGLVVFDRNLVFQKIIHLSGLVDAVEARPGGGIAAYVSTFEAPGRIILLDRRGEPDGELRYMSKSEGLLLDSVSVAPASGGTLYLGFLFLDRLERWDAAGTRRWSIGLFGSKDAVMTNLGGLALPKETCILDVAVDSRGRVYALGGKRAKNAGRDAFVLDGAGKVEAAFTLPEPSHCLYFDDRDFLYVRADSGVTLKKYRLIFE